MMAAMMTAVVTAVMAAGIAMVELACKDWFLARFAHTREPTERPEDENQQAHHAPRHTTNPIGDDMVSLTLLLAVLNVDLSLRNYLPLLHLPLLHLPLWDVNWLTLLLTLLLVLHRLCLGILTLLLHRLLLRHWLLLRHRLRRGLVSVVSWSFIIRMTLYRASGVVECLG